MQWSIGLFILEIQYLLDDSIIESLVGEEFYKDLEAFYVSLPTTNVEDV